MNRFVILSGCSGGGKSTLLAALHARGFPVVEEPGRRIIAEENESGGTALPWIDMAGFARRAMEMALEDRRAMGAATSWVFFDRGLIDAAAALQHTTGEPVLDRLGQAHRYHRRVFLTPPWPEIYGRDADRRHDFSEAVDEYERLLRVYAALGYECLILPKAGVEARAEYVLARLGEAG